MRDTLEVMFCCNDRSGNDTGFVAQIDAGELIRLEGPADWDDEELSAMTPFRYHVPPYLCVGGGSFRATDRRTHVGNIHWDSFRMSPDEFCRLLNHLLKTGEWTCTEAETSLFRAWHEGQPITAEMLGRDDAR